MIRIYQRAITICFCLLLTAFLNLFSQNIPHSVNNTGVYEFLDELANSQIITVNSAVKPWTRLYIAQKLDEADVKREMLNERQKKELDFYLRDFGKEGRSGTGAHTAFAKASDSVRRSGLRPTKSAVEGLSGAGKRVDLFYYRDSLFSITINPIFGGELFSNSAGNATYWRNGAEFHGYIKNWGFYASLRDNHEKPILGLAQYLTQREGGHIKGGTDWSEMQGGVTYSWGWGNIGLVKDRVQWGTNYNGANIFGGHNPTFVMLKLQVTPVKWLDFNYYHGWLNSRVVDSTR